jgi:hypothetical protein
MEAASVYKGRNSETDAMTDQPAIGQLAINLCRYAQFDPRTKCGRSTSRGFRLDHVAAA